MINFKILIWGVKAIAVSSVVRAHCNAGHEILSFAKGCQLNSEYGMSRTKGLGMHHRQCDLMQIMGLLFA